MAAHDASHVPAWVEPMLAKADGGRLRSGREWAYDPLRDWFLQNVRLVEAMTEKGYDINYCWGIGLHGQKQGGAMLPEMMRWLWRDQSVSVDPHDMVERSFRRKK